MLVNLLSSNLHIRVLKTGISSGSNICTGHISCMSFLQIQNNILESKVMSGSAQTTLQIYHVVMKLVRPQ